MFNFANPQYLYLLVLVPILFLLYWMAQKNKVKKLNLFGNKQVIAHLMPNASKYMHGIKIVLQLVIIMIFVVIICRPRNGEKEQTSTINGIELFVALDVSNSMLASATDDPNGTSRLSRAKLLLEKLFDEFNNNKIGLIVFAGDAYLQLPMTTDYVSAQQFLDIISTDMVSSQGTAIAEAIELAMSAYTADNNMHKSLILITDCEDHIGDGIEMAERALKQNIQVNVIGFGSKAGAPIPINSERTEYLTDNGVIVRTALNEQLAQDIAKAGNGVYVNGASNKALNDISTQLEKLSKSELKTIKYKSTAEQFPLFAWIVLVLLIIELFVLDKKIEWLKKFNFFNK